MNVPEIMLASLFPSIFLGGCFYALTNFRITQLEKKAEKIDRIEIMVAEIRTTINDLFRIKLRSGSNNTE